MSLTITTVPTILNYETTKEHLEINTQKPSLHYTHIPPKFNIEKTLDVLEIDQYQAFASCGRKNSADLIKDAAQNGAQAAEEYTEKIASDGDMLSTSLSTNQNLIALLAERDSNQTYEFAMAFLPSVGPEFRVRKGEFNIDIQVSDKPIEINYIPGSINIQYTPSQRHMHVVQYGKVNIELKKGSNFDKSV